MRQKSEIEVTLPNGYWRDGICVRKVCVREIPERDEAACAVAIDDLPLKRTSALLERYAAIDSTNDAGWVDEITLGDREMLLLHLLRLTFGNRIPCTLKCPVCMEFMDFELHADQLLLPGAASPKQFHQETFAVDEAHWQVRFRVPRARDVEAAIVGGRSTPDAAAMLLRHCVEEVCRETGSGEHESAAPDRWPAGLDTQIGARLAEIDPQAEIDLSLDCPACGNHFSSAFDTGDYLHRELETRERQLLYDVHRLAMAYHWSEEEILRMTLRKRKQYLELVGDGFQ
jgi:hypothetical protein